MTDGQTGIICPPRRVARIFRVARDNRHGGPMAFVPGNDGTLAAQATLDTRIVPMPELTLNLDLSLLQSPRHGGVHNPVRLR